MEFEKIKIGYSRLRDSSNFYDSISEEDFFEPGISLFDDKPSVTLSQLNLELQSLSKKVRLESISLSRKASVFLFFFKLFGFGGVLVNIIGGIVANVYPNSTFNKISAFLAAMCSAVLLSFNLKDQGNERKRISNQLKIMEQEIKKALLHDKREEKYNLITQIKSKLIESDYVIYKISSSEGSGYAG